ncbi:hypothetical protein EJF36_12650 [Bacillus sp. HMF5848]|uniref:hypothetical protein n=1 Tax=Bacillus sp. HMF5848 TaxID=2495421 RepID=UPI000F788BF2|nr:hypothetical protein [Bacillus sp. HMF5848]RSK27657.1 hypothetical protein EJF36_12650 [Bacillus sp. HMF5848]
MLKKMYLLLLLLLVSFTGCSTESTLEQVSHEDNNKLQSEVLEADNDDLVKTVQEKMQLNLTKENVTDLLGNQYQKIKSSYDDSDMWRYDIGTKEGYQSPDDEYDTGDIQGLQNGSIQAQLFISWNEENRVRNYSIIYYDSNDSKVYDYRVFSDGGERVQALTN